MQPPVVRAVAIERWGGRPYICVLSVPFFSPLLARGVCLYVCKRRARRPVRTARSPCATDTAIQFEDAAAPLMPLLPPSPFPTLHTNPKWHGPSSTPSPSPPKQQPPNPAQHKPRHHPAHNQDRRQLEHRHAITLPRHASQPARTAADVVGHAAEDLGGRVDRLLRARIVVDVQCDVLELGGFGGEGGEEGGVLS